MLTTRFGPGVLLSWLTVGALIAAPADEGPPKDASPRSASPFADLIGEESSQISPQVKALLGQHRAWLAAPLPQNPEQESAVLRQLAESGEDVAQGYLHLVFETFPERRQLVALAVVRYAELHRRRPQDWRLLVRALNVVEGPQVEHIVRALSRFPQRATKPRWIRTVLLHALCAEPGGVEPCLALLKKWSGRDVVNEGRPEEQLAGWQQWFAETWPEEPDPRLPLPQQGARWQYQPLADFLYSPEGLSGDGARGAEVFRRAECHKCHRFGHGGEQMGPDLSEIAGRMQRKEILHAIVYPSEYVSDQYQSYTLVTGDGRTVTGVVGAGTGGKLTVLQLNGEKSELDRQDVEMTVRNRQSAMPTGALSKLTRQDIADLFAYLCQKAE